MKKLSPRPRKTLIVSCLSATLGLGLLAGCVDKNPMPYPGGMATDTANDTGDSSTETTGSEATNTAVPSDDTSSTKDTAYNY